MEQFDGTTILSVRKDGRVTIGGDGQVSMGNTCVKGNARKVRRLYKDQVIAGFAGGTADAFTLFERFEGKLEKHPDYRALRRLEALLLVADRDASLMITGNGDVIEPEPHGVMAIGSGGSFAMAAALALVDVPGMGSRDIVEKAMHIAADICIYTNHNLTIETFE